MLLYGGSGHAKVIRDCVKAMGQEVYFIFDDNSELKTLNETPIIGPYNPAFNIHEEIVIAIGNNMLRKVVSEKIVHKFARVIHPSVLRSPYASVDVGTVVFHGAVLQADAKVGKHAIINTNAIVEHDCVLDDFVHISPNATLCGNVKVGEGTHVGAGAVVIPNITIGKWCVIGAGSVIIKDIPDYAVVVGSPGRVIKTLEVKV
ncbi:MAG TPA: acetyltransferase [Cytophagaceae bacterium]